ncbi:PmoA family protein [Arthrobacter tecti]
MSELSVRRPGNSELVVSYGSVDLATYVFIPAATRSEAPKPYLHPLRTLSGAPLTGFRPWDHRWHKGLQMTWSHVSGQNFWGGPTFSPETDYQWRDNLGSIEHDSFAAVTTSADRVTLTEALTWRNSAGERWLSEERSTVFSGVDVQEQSWQLDFSTELTNVSGRSLDLGSPTTHGRPNAGYTGFFWRGPRSWTGCSILGPDGAEGEAMMGASTPWIALAGEHDELDGGATIVAMAGTSSSSVPLKWFVRSEPFAALAPSPSFDEEISLAPGESLRLQHRYVFVDRICGRDDVERIAKAASL